MNGSFKADIMTSLNAELAESNYVFLDKSWQHDNVCDPFARLYFIRNGSGFLKSGKDLIQLTGGFVYLIPSGCLFSYGCTALEKLYFHIALTSREKNDLLSAPKKIYSLPFAEEDFQQLLNAYQADDYLSLLKVKVLLQQTLLHFAEEYQFGVVPVKQYSELTEQILNMIQKNLQINLTVASISRKLFISESKIRKIFKEEIGMPIGAYIDELVFLKSRQLLAKKYLSIGDISQALGFCDQFYFARRFKQKYNQSPSSFRAEILSGEKKAAEKKE